MKLILLLLIAAAVYVLFFRKYDVNGKEVKGWLAKRNAEQNQQPQGFEQSQPDRPVGNMDTSRREGSKKKSIHVDAAPTAVHSNGSGGHKAGEVDYTIILKPTEQSNKLAVVKAVKDGLGIGLKEAKELVDQPGDKILVEHVDKAEAEKLKNLLIEAKASFQLKEYKY